MSKPRPKPRTKSTLLDRLTPVVLDQLHTRTLTGRKLAAELGVSETHLSRVLSLEGFKKLPGPVLQQRKANATLAKTRTEHRRILAQRVIDKDISMAKACKLANCTERTMWRYLAKVRD